MKQGFLLIGFHFKIGKLLYVHRIDLAQVPIEGLSSHQNIHSFCWVECIPEHILFSVRTRCLEWKTCNLTSISPNAAASTVYNTKSYKEISAKIKIKKKTTQDTIHTIY